MIYLRIQTCIILVENIEIKILYVISKMLILWNCDRWKFLISLKFNVNALNVLSELYTISYKKNVYTFY